MHVEKLLVDVELDFSKDYKGMDMILISALILRQGKVREYSSNLLLFVYTWALSPSLAHYYRAALVPGGLRRAELFC